MQPGRQRRTAWMLLLPMVILSSLFVRLAARIPYARETGKRCIFCHATTQPSAEDLHWAGEYYAEKRTLKGYRPDPSMALGVTAKDVETADAEEPPSSKAVPASVGETYRTKCAACHGPQGKGTPGMDAGDFTDPAWQASRTDHQIRQAIAEGRPPMMPGFADILNEETLRGLVKLIRQFGPANQDEENEKAASEERMN